VLAVVVIICCVLFSQVMLHHSRQAVGSKRLSANASHTHFAPPLTEDMTVLLEHLDQEYSDRVLSEAVAVVGDVIGRLEPARVITKLMMTRKVEDARHMLPVSVIGHGLSALTGNAPRHGIVTWRLSLESA
jgi:hypothetical protein